jgi:drug/metabolite transporter (DMT)-like permease
VNASRGLVRCGIAALLFGAATPLAARIAATSGAPALAGLLYVGAAIGVAPFVRRLPSAGAVAHEGRRLAAAVVFGGFVAPLLLAAGLARTDGATASLMLNLELVATVVLASLFFREHLGRRVVVGVAIVVTASVVLTWSNAPGLRGGALLVAAACLCWGVDNCATANMVELAPEVITLAKGVIAGPTNLVLALAMHAAFPSGARIVGALAIGAAGYGLSITLWIRGARDLGAARGQLVFAAAPFAGVTIAWFVLGESVRVGQLVALALALVGIGTVLRSEHEHTHAHPAAQHEHEHAHDDGHHSHAHDGAGAEPHTHPHVHAAVTHAHPHLPDVHHRHAH